MASATMFEFEAATILMEISNFKCNNNNSINSIDDRNLPIRKRKIRNYNVEPDFAFVPRRSRTSRTVEITKKAKKVNSTAAAPKHKAKKVKPVAARKQKAKEVNLTTTPEMPAAMRERISEMGGYEMELVIQKQLSDTDLNKNQGRLSLSIQKLKFDFATEEEGKLLNQHVEKKSKMGMDVMIIDPCLRESVICLKKWKIGSGDVYCLMTHWNSLVQQNGFKSGEVVQLWSFRKDGVDAANQTEKSHHLCFAMANPDASYFL